MKGFSIALKIHGYLEVYFYSPSVLRLFTVE